MDQMSEKINHAINSVLALPLGNAQSAILARLAAGEELDHEQLKAAVVATLSEAFPAKKDTYHISELHPAQVLVAPQILPGERTLIMTSKPVVGAQCYQVVAEIPAMPKGDQPTPEGQVRAKPVVSLLQIDETDHRNSTFINFNELELQAELDRQIDEIARLGGTRVLAYVSCVQLVPPVETAPQEA